MNEYEFCPRCGHEVYGHGVYCPVCGLDLDMVARKPPMTDEELQDLP